MADLEKKIIEVAARMFVEEGYGQATTKKIAKEAGVHEMTLFRKFGSKDNLLEAVMARNEKIIRQMMDLALPTECDSDMRTCLRNLGQKLIALSAEFNLLIVLFEARLRIPKIGERMATNMKMMVERLSKYFESQIKRGKMRKVDPEAAAWIFFGHLASNNLFRGLPLDETLGNREKGFDEFIEIFVKGVSKPEKH